MHIVRVIAVLALSAGLAAFQEPPPPPVVPVVPRLPPMSPRMLPPPQTVPGTQLPVFRARTDLIQVDVSVLDKDRRPARGLKAEDFTIRENGVVQPVAALVEMAASDPEGDPDSWMRTVTPDVRVNNAEDGRVLLILMDDGRVARSAFDTRTRENAFKQVARAIVDRMGRADLAAVIFTMKNKNEQEFTSNHDQLFKAIDGFEFPLSTAYANDLADSTLVDAAKILGSIEQRRKAVVLLTTRPPQVAPLGVSPIYAKEEVRPGVTIAQELRPGKTAQDMLKAAMSGNVTFYTINPLRMNNLTDEVDQLLDPAMADAPTAGFTAPTSAPPGAPASLRDVRTVSLDQATGGFAIRRPQDFAEGVTQIFREIGSYYLLGYANPSPEQSDRARQIEVTVNRPGLAVRSRGEYLPPQVEKQKPASPLWSAISGLLPAKDIPMRVNIAPFAIPGKDDASVLIVLGLREPLPIGAGVPVNEIVEFMTRAYTPSGQDKGNQAQTVQLQLLPNPRGEVKYEIYSLMKLKPGRYHLRLSALSRMQRRSGSVYQDIEIPDFRKLPVSLSGVVLSAKPPLTAGPPKVFDAILPVKPTTQREFAGHTGAAFMRIYQGGKASFTDARIDVTILDSHESTVFSKVDALPAGKFDAKARSADYSFELPVDRLQPGAHVVQFRATLPGGATFSRDVRFVVREQRP